MLQTSLRGGVAGAVATAVMTLEQPLDKRLFDSKYDDVEMFLTQYLAAFSLYEWEIRDLIAVGDDRVLACAAIRAEGRGSGITLQGELYQCYWLRHGGFFRVEDHLTLKGALHALGLQGETLEAAGLREPA
jgi:hypothetical protein